MNPFRRAGSAMIGVMASLVSMSVASGAGERVTSQAASGGSPTFTLPKLPYAQDALKPCKSARTMSLHCGKRHQAYVDGLNRLVVGTPWATGQMLEKIVLDYQNRRKDFVQAFLDHLVNWDFASSQLK